MTGDADGESLDAEGPGKPTELIGGERAGDVLPDPLPAPVSAGRIRISRRLAARALGLVLVGAVGGWALGYRMGYRGRANSPSSSPVVAPKYALPFEWGDLGARLVREGAIDRDRVLARFAQSSALPYLTAVLDGRPEPGPQEITAANAEVLLDLLWAFGLANRNPVLLAGPIGQDPAKIGGYASTGGWTLARGDGPSHIAAYDLVALDPGQQARVESLARVIYRPCCNNSTWFPDCNHGMAMLGLLELMSAGGASEREMARAAIVVNTFWFPAQYQDLARLFSLQGKRWEDAVPLELLGEQYSSASGVQRWRATLPPAPPGAQPGGGCAA